jgi:multidrug efflux pump subunit AcrA (membrane-fusion protein)
VDKESDGAGGEQTVLKPVTVKLGISDATSIEVLEGLKEGDVVATGVLSKTAAAATPARGSPFGSPFGGGRPR